MTQTVLRTIDLDPALRHHDSERVALTDEELAMQREADREAVSTLYAGVGGVDVTRIDRTLNREARNEIGPDNRSRREASAGEVLDTLQGNRLDAVTHDKNVDTIQADASAGITRLTGEQNSQTPDRADVERRVFGEDMGNTLEGKSAEGLGLDTYDQREITRAAMAGELMRKIMEDHDTSLLDTLPPQSGIWVASRIKRLVEQYGSADRAPTEELALIGRYLERTDSGTPASDRE